MNAINKPNEVSMFKVGDKVVNIEHINSDVQKIELVEEKRIKVFSKNMAFSYWVFKFQFRHATAQEIASGHRIDHISQEGNMVHDLGDDSHIENHVSPNCKKFDERVK